MHLPDRMPTGAQPPGITPKLKRVFTLQGGASFANATDVAVVVCITLKSPRSPRPFEVLVDERHGFDHATMIDCRWVFTIQIRHLRAAQQPELPPQVMQEISEALTAGLQL
jgi:mRNA-degrading endonuclease toxin of MazEF toxin-antitoxin module